MIVNHDSGIFFVVKHGVQPEEYDVDTFVLIVADKFGVLSF